MYTALARLYGCCDIAIVENNAAIWIGYLGYENSVSVIRHRYRYSKYGTVVDYPAVSSPHFLNRKGVYSRCIKLDTTELNTAVRIVYSGRGCISLTVFHNEAEHTVL